VPGVAFAERVKQALGIGERVTGFPTSSNRASSMHLRWVLPASADLVDVRATLEVVEPPAAPHLYFWALQASFVDRGRHLGAGHLGLQWYAAHPGGTAANWGGYRAGGGELTGTASPLPSATANPNTRDFAWQPRRPYVLRIAAAGDGRWRGSVDEAAIRELDGGGTALADVVVWSEVFARCDDPPVAVRWSGFEARTASGDVVRPTAVVTSYQQRGDGGCDNTTARPDGDGVLQLTNTPRAVPPGATIPFSRS
jgi:hypothetical protein